MNGAAIVSSAPLPTVADANWQLAGAADFNGDGHPDLVWRHAVTGAVSRYHVMHPGGGTAYATSYTVQKIVESRPVHLR